MYGSYLTYMQIDDYLAAMETTGLVKYNRETGTFKITAKGADFLSSLNEMDYLLDTMD